MAQGPAPTHERSGHLLGHRFARSRPPSFGGATGRYFPPGGMDRGIQTKETKMTETAKQWVTIGAVADIPDPAVARARARDILMARRDGIPLVSMAGAANDVGRPAANRALIAERSASANNAFVMRLPLYLEYCE